MDKEPAKRPKTSTRHEVKLSPEAKKTLETYVLNRKVSKTVACDHAWDFYQSVLEKSGNWPPRCLDPKDITWDKDLADQIMASKDYLAWTKIVQKEEAVLHSHTIGHLFKEGRIDRQMAMQCCLLFLHWDRNQATKFLNIAGGFMGEGGGQKRDE